MCLSLINPKYYESRTIYIHIHIGSRLFELFSNDVYVNKKPGMYLMWMDKKNTILKAILTDAHGRFWVIIPFY